MSRLADDLAHEIKNPLSSVVINLELMRQRVLKGDATVAIERAAVIEEEVHRVHNLVDGLLRLLRPQRSGGGPTSVAEAVATVTPLIEARAHTLTVPWEVGPLPLEAYTAIGADAVRFAVLITALDALAIAELTGGSVALESEVTAEALTLLLRVSVAQLHNVVAAADPERDDAMRLARELIAPRGGSIEASGGSYAIRLPLTKR